MKPDDLRKLEETRRRSLDICASLSQAQMDFSPSPSGWSAGEIFDHLLLSEAVYLRDMRELIRLARSGQPARIRRSFADIDIGVAFIPKAMLPFLELPLTMANMFIPPAIRETLALNRIIPAQNPSIATPRKGRPVQQLCAELGRSLQEIVNLVEGNADLDYSRMTLSHPLLGENNLCQILRLIWIHEARHQQQLQEVLAAAGFPSA